MKSNLINEKAQYLWILVMLSMTFPLFQGLPVFNRPYIFWGISLGLALMMTPKYFNSKSFTLVVIYFLIVWINHIAGDNYFKETKICINELLFLFIPSSMIYFLFKYGDFRCFKILLLVFCVCLIESSVISYIANEFLPGIIRLQASGVEEYSSLLLPFMRKGMSDYNMPHALPVLVPGFVYAIKNTKKMMRYFLLISLIALFFIVFVSSSFTALLFVVISLLLSLIINPDSIKTSSIRLITIMVILLPVLSSETVMLSALETADSIFPEESVAHRKITDIEESILYGDAEGGLENRQKLYDITLSEITGRLIIGTDAGVGGHSALLDRLAVLGLVGMIPLFLFVYNQIKHVRNKIKGPQLLYYYVGIIMAVLMMFSKNMSKWSMWFFLLFLLPGMIYYFAPLENNKKLKIDAKK